MKRLKISSILIVLLLFLFLSSVTALGNDIFVDSGQDLGSVWSREVVLGVLAVMAT